jgi:hypothetical protein
VSGPPTEAQTGPASHLQQYLFVQVDTGENPALPPLSRKRPSLLKNPPVR